MRTKKREAPTVNSGASRRQLRVEDVAEHAQDLAALVADDGAGLLVEQHGHGEAAGVVGVHAEVDVPEVRVALVARQRVRHHVLARRVRVLPRCEPPSWMTSRAPVGQLDPPSRWENPGRA